MSTTTKKVLPDYDESAETYSEDPDADADEIPLMPPMQQEETGDQHVHKVSRVPKQKVQVHKPTPREIHDAVLFKYDSLRRKDRKSSH